MAIQHIQDIALRRASPPTPEPDPAPLRGAAKAKLISTVSDYITTGPGWTEAESSNATEARELAMEAATHMFRHAPGYCLAFIGQTTCGKTFLARKLKKWWSEVARFAGGTEWKYDHGEWISWPNHTYEEVEEKGQTTGLLVIDEAGRGRTGAVASTAAVDRLIETLSIREHRRLFTVVTANWTADCVPDRALLERLRRPPARCLQSPVSLRPYNKRLPDETAGTGRIFTATEQP